MGQVPALLLWRTPNATGTVSTLIQCYCCGEERDRRWLHRSQCHDDIKVCRICIGWLMRHAGGVDVTPTLPVSDMNSAAAFYETAGFDVQRYDDGFAFVRLGDQSLFDLDLIEATNPATNARVLHDRGRR